MRLCSIASGSSGNSTFVASECTNVLVDAGISAKRVEEGLNGLGVKASELDAIFITHEHIDHIKGIGVLSRKHGIPIYATKGTIAGIKNCSSLGQIDFSLLNEIKADCEITVKDLKINPVTISHDANDPVAYRIKCDGKKVGIVTDLGNYNPYIIECFKNSDVLLCEANHDIRMLQVGPYPYYLKQRILSDHGHLSNEASGKMISELLHDGIKRIYLGHLSHENNLPELAYETVRLEIEAADNKYHSNDFPIIVAKRDCPTEEICF